MSGVARAYRPKYVVFNGKKIPAGTVANYINHRPPCFPLKPRGDSTGKDLSLSPPATATGTNAEVGGGSKGPAADPSEPVGIKAEGTKAEVQGGSLLKRPCDVLGESSDILREVKKQTFLGSKAELKGGTTFNKDLG
uniref:uncharacterized protein LOC122597886 isoform X3 n=1 Tax=Erigeron canadensis TaxID=72917 RepID=UPI001CB99A73|nr:uncharacterized protein LOC122597886 isoform X3 [Erigeron canadensis]